MSESRLTLILAVVLLFVMCLAWFFVFYQPRKVEVYALKQDTENLLVKLRSFRVTDKQIVSLEKQIEKLEEEIAVTQSKVFAKSNLPFIVRQIEKKGRIYGLKFSNILPEYDSLVRFPEAEEQRSDLIKLVVHFKIQGSYKNFGKFIENLADLPFFISLGEISLYYNEDIYPELEITLDVVLYLQETVERDVKT
jgi:Tfp pilus assembly protein PilO